MELSNLYQNGFQEFRYLAVVELLDLKRTSSYNPRPLVLVELLDYLLPAFLLCTSWIF